MIMRRYLLFAFIGMIASSGVLGQDGSKGRGSMSSRQGTMEGRVFAEGDGPMEYANVALYNRADSSLITGTVTNAEGKFVLKEIPFGQYYLEANFIGFRKKRIDDIHMNGNNPDQDLGRLFLEQTSQNIEGVEVTANRPQVNYQVDKKVIQVAGDYTAEGGSAVRVLENVPSIQVDIEGNVELRGSSNFRVLVQFQFQGAGRRQTHRSGWK